MRQRFSNSRSLGFQPFCVFLLSFALAAGGALADDGRSDLLAAPKYVEPAQEPGYTELTSDQLQASLQVVAARTYAYYGFNNPEIQLHLPLVGNSTLARVEMSEPRLFDASGGEVAYQLEPGLHDPATQIAEIRFVTTDGESPASFARAKGQIAIRYPLVVQTHTVEPGRVKPGTNFPGIQLDGPFVDMDDGTLPETAPFAEIQPLRAYDAQGRQLQAELTGSTRVEGDRVIRRLGFHGQVARVEVDQVSQWADVTIRYDVPIAKSLPAPQRGAADVDERAVQVDPKSKIEIEIGQRAGSGSGGNGGGSGALSAQARSFADALKALSQALPDSPSIVSLTGSPPGFVSIAADSNGQVQEWSWSASGVSGPTAMVTDWLDCKTGMVPGALDLDRLPELLDEAAQQVGDGDRPIQLSVGQSPCGTPFIYIPFEGGRWVQYDASGEVIKAE